MGAGSYSHAEYLTRSATRAAAGVSAFEHTDAIRQGRAVAGTHPEMDPMNVMRESRDSDEHPESNAIAVMFDVTGSMQRVPVVFQQQLSRLMQLLVDGKFVPHPQVLVGAVNDSTTNCKSPLQVGQFESNINIDTDLSRIFLEGGGGGTDEESYELCAEFLASHTSIDCFEKRNKKGYAFIIGDERTHQLKQAHLTRIFGNAGQATTTEEVFQMAQSKYEVFYIMPNGTANYGRSVILEPWRKLLGAEYVIQLSDATNICELIAAIIGIKEGFSKESIFNQMRTLGCQTNAVGGVAADLANFVEAPNARDISLMNPAAPVDSPRHLLI